MFSQSPRDIASCVSGDQNMHFKKYILKIDVVDMTLTLDPHFVQRSCLFLVSREKRLIDMALVLSV